MQHNELIDTMLHTITVGRAVTRDRLTNDGKARDPFILSGFNGGQLEVIKQFIASFRLNA